MLSPTTGDLLSLNVTGSANTTRVAEHPQLVRRAGFPARDDKNWELLI